MVAWGVDKWIRYPEARASQLGFEAPLWPAFVAFTLLGTGVAASLLWATARRVEAGEDLFQKRRKRGSVEEEKTASNHEQAPGNLHRSS